MPTTATSAPHLIGAEGDPADARWLTEPIIDGENIVAARGVYAPGAHCSVGQSAGTLLKKASASPTTSLHRNAVDGEAWTSARMDAAPVG